jgi:hypothetical protein
VSYGTLAGWRAYALERGNSAPTDATDPVASAALKRAEDYIKYNYVAYFYASYTEDLPEVEFATYEAANYELATPGFFSVTYTPSQQSVLTEVDGIKWTVVNNMDSNESFSNASPVSNRVEAMLRKYLPSKNSVGIMSVGPKP